MTAESLRPLYTSGLVKLPNMILLLLSDEDGIQVSALAGKLGAPTSGVSMAESKLADADLVVRAYPYSDQRQVTVRLTPTGMEAADVMLDALKILASQAAGK